MKIVLLKLILLLFFFNTSAKESLKYNFAASNSWYPYYIPSDKDAGILGELVPLILKAANINGVEVKFPPKRTIYALDNGLIDFDIISPAWFPNRDTGDSFVLSDSLFFVAEYYASLESSTNAPIAFGDDIGTVMGYYYFDDNTFTRIDFKSEKELVLALSKKRVDKVLIGDLPAKYWGRKLNIAVRLDSLHSRGELRIRLNKSKKHLLIHINEAIKQLKQSGKIDEIVEKYSNW